MKEVKVNWLEAVHKGDVPSVFRKRSTPVPGDALFAQIEVDGITFACTAVTHGNENVTPEQFEYAIQAMLAGLRECMGLKHTQGVFVVPEGPAN